MKQNNITYILLSFIFISFITAGCTQKKTKEEWKLVWSEEFEQTDHFDTQVWSKTPRGNADWCDYMTDDEICYEMRDGNLVLRGIVTPKDSKDTVPYLTGGVWGKDKKVFGNGRIEIKAKLDEGTGVWPAIWMLPAEVKWPYGGEIDIMEHLNQDTIVYQTLHTYYTLELGGKDKPTSSGVNSAYKKNEYNVYALEMYTDSLAFFVNDVHTFTYPRIETDKEEQFPFNDQPFYLLMTMQMGGSWVGEVDPKDLPVEMHIDWVRFYEKSNKE